MWDFLDHYYFTPVFPKWGSCVPCGRDLSGHHSRRGAKSPTMSKVAPFPTITTTNIPHMSTVQICFKTAPLKTFF